jgi:hypothetical protein
VANYELTYRGPADVFVDEVTGLRWARRVITDVKGQEAPRVEYDTHVVDEATKDRLATPPAVPHRNSHSWQVKEVSEGRKSRAAVADEPGAVAGSDSEPPGSE